MSIEYGQAAIAAFTEAVGSMGELKFDEAAVRDVARQYDNLINELMDAQELLGGVTRPTGFGGLVSAQQLADGFGRKAQQLIDILDLFIAGAHQLKAGYLRAGELYEEADLANAAALQRFAAANDSEV